MLLDVDRGEELGLSKTRLATFARLTGIGLLCFLIFNSFAPAHLPDTELLALSELMNLGLLALKTQQNRLGSSYSPDSCCLFK